MDYPSVGRAFSNGLICWQVRKQHEWWAIRLQLSEKLEPSAQASKGTKERLNILR
jgi:hypothetical protein